MRDDCGTQRQSRTAADVPATGGLSTSGCGSCREGTSTTQETLRRQQLARSKRRPAGAPHDAAPCDLINLRSELWTGRAHSRGEKGPRTRPAAAPEVAVVLEQDATAARGLARQYMSAYLAMPNYTNNLRRFGWIDEDFADGGSDRLVDALIPWGTREQVTAGIERHYEAGADEVAIQVLNGGDATAYPADAFRALAAALI